MGASWQFRPEKPYIVQTLQGKAKRMDKWHQFTNFQRADPNDISSSWTFRHLMVKLLKVVLVSSSIGHILRNHTRYFDQFGSYCRFAGSPILPKGTKYHCWTRIKPKHESLQLLDFHSAHHHQCRAMGPAQLSAVVWVQPYLHLEDNLTNEQIFPCDVDKHNHHPNSSKLSDLRSVLWSWRSSWDSIWLSGDSFGSQFATDGDQPFRTDSEYLLENQMFEELLDTLSIS